LATGQNGRGWPGRMGGGNSHGHKFNPKKLIDKPRNTRIIRKETGRGIAGTENSPLPADSQTSLIFVDFVDFVV
jgi:hypothetical protein